MFTTRLSMTTMVSSLSDTNETKRRAGEIVAMHAALTLPMVACSSFRDITQRSREMGAISAFVFGLLAYACGLTALVYSIGFVGNLVVPKSIDVGATGSIAEAVVVNVLLLGLFAVQH